jgi:hypothetical protein
LKWIEICAGFEGAESEGGDALDLGFCDCFDAVCHMVLCDLVNKCIFECGLAEVRRDVGGMEYFNFSRIPGMLMRTSL